MNVVTIMNYDFSRRENVVMCLMWAHSVAKNCSSNKNIIVLSDSPLPSAMTDFMSQYGIRNEVCGEYKDSSIHHNYRFKLYNLSHLDFPFIFLDADMFVMGSLEYLWDRRNEKPWIGIDHQLNIPGHTGRKPFLNSGLQIVGDNSFYKFKDIIKVGIERDFKFEVHGRDQAILWTYFKTIGYDYTHEDIGPEWNACAGYVKLFQDDRCKWSGVSTLEQMNVYINHYWDCFKPYYISCPAYQWYDKNCPVIKV